MKARDYKHFNNLFTRRLNKVFTGELLPRFKLMILAGGQENIYERFSKVVDEYGDDTQKQAYRELRELMDDNPEFTEEMNKKTTPIADKQMPEFLS